MEQNAAPFVRSSFLQRSKWAVCVVMDLTVPEACVHLMGPIRKTSQGSELAYELQAGPWKDNFLGPYPKLKSEK